MRYSVYDLTRWSLLASIALTLSILESVLLPEGVLPIPGVKLGLANIASLLAIYLFGALPGVLIVLIRCLVVLTMSGNLISFLMSLTGALMALFIMLLLRNTGKFSLFGVSIGGAAGHSIGQIIIACLFTGTWSLVSYLPVLLLVSVFTGFFIALLSIPVYKALISTRLGGNSL